MAAVKGKQPLLTAANVFGLATNLGCYTTSIRVMSLAINKATKMADIVVGLFAVFFFYQVPTINGLIILGLFMLSDNFNLGLSISVRRIQVNDRFGTRFTVR